jgi:Xaa-Pro dipeptidase
MTIMSNGHHDPRAQYRLKKGDLFRYDGGSIYKRYHSDAGGGAVLGPSTEKQRSCYRAIEAGLEKAVEFLRPGAIPSWLFEEIVQAVEKAGLREYWQYAYFCGHGIGIEVRGYPIFSRPMKARSPFLPGTYDLPVEEGMVISIEVPYFELGLGGFQTEYTLLVKEDGREKLYPDDRELVIR